MQYFGGKQRVADEIVEIINLFRGDRPYFEPFVGGANIIHRVRGGIRIASDVVPELVEMYRALQCGWNPPSTLTREEYDRLRHDTAPTPLRAFAAFGCSFAGKYFGGYASSGDRNYAANAASSLAAKRGGLSDVEFLCADYRTFQPGGCLIYCDPPYSGTTSYTAAGRFDSDEFWRICRKWAEQNIVLVSEYTAPPDATVVWEKQVITDIRGTSGRLDRTEKLFLLAH